MPTILIEHLSCLKDRQRFVVSGMVNETDDISIKLDEKLQKKFIRTVFGIDTVVRSCEIYLLRRTHQNVQSVGLESEALKLKRETKEY